MPVYLASDALEDQIVAGDSAAGQRPEHSSMIHQGVEDGGAHPVRGAAQVVTSNDRGTQWRETAGELSYLSIRLLDFVTALPPGALPPRGRVPWSASELTELGRLTRVLACGEQDAERAAASMGAIDNVFQRAYGQTGPAGGMVEAALLEGYIAHRRTAMQSLPRLQRLGDERPGAPSPTPRPAPRLPWWRAALRYFRQT